MFVYWCYAIRAPGSLCKMNLQALVRSSGGVTPLIHAMRIGRSHHDVAITLLGAFSRYINHLDAEDFVKQETRSLLVSLRE